MRSSGIFLSQASSRLDEFTDDELHMKTGSSVNNDKLNQGRTPQFLLSQETRPESLV